MLNSSRHAEPAQLMVQLDQRAGAAHRSYIRSPKSTVLTSGSAGLRRFLILQAQFHCNDHILEGGPSTPVVDDPDHRERLEHLSQEEDMTWKSGSPLESLHIHLEGGNFLTVICNGYQGDTLFLKIIANIAQRPLYTMRDVFHERSGQSGHRHPRISFQRGEGDRDIDRPCPSHRQS